MSARGRTRRATTLVGATPGEIAWVAALPALALLVAAMALLDRPLGRLLFAAPHADFWPFWRARLGVLPEPSERTAYLLAVLAPAVVAAVVALGARRRIALAPGLLRVAVPLAQALVPCALVVAIVAQRLRVFGLPWSEVPKHVAYFTLPTLVVAALVAAGLALALRSADLVARIARLTRETRARRLGALALAGLLAAAWLLTAINTEASMANGNYRIFVNLPFWLDESFAVLDGRVPLVDFHTQYGHLFAYVGAGAMALFGTSLGVYTTTMTAGSWLAALALYGVLRRVVRRSLLALALFAPVLSTGFFTELGPPDARHGPQTLFSVFPMRYLGAYGLAWLTARHLDGAAPRRRWALFAAGGAVAINNLEFGLSALVATLLALALVQVRSLAQLGRLLGEAALGVLVALAGLCALTLLRSGSLPHLGMLLTFPRLYGIDAFGLMPMPHLGFQLAIYATFAAAVVLAAVRATAGAARGAGGGRVASGGGPPCADLLTAMLAWSGVFGLGAASYYAGRSLPEVLLSIFSAWALALALLLVAAVRAILARPARRPTLAEAGLLLAFGLTVCSIAQTPAPWSQIARLRDTSSARPLSVAATARAIGAVTRRGEPVAILGPLGHQIAYELGIENISPYVSIESMPLRGQLAEAIAALRAAGGTELFLPVAQSQPEQVAAARRAGFRLVREDRAANVIELVDATRGGVSGG